MRRGGAEGTRGAILAGLLAIVGSITCGAATASDATLVDDFDALLPVGRAVCYVGRPQDPLISRIRLHRLEQTMSANPEETGPGRGVLAIVDVLPRGQDALAGRAFCSASSQLGAISCSDDSGCDRADRLRLARTPDGVRVTFREPFSFAGVGCGGVEDEEGAEPPPGLDLPDPRSGATSFDLVARSLDECR